MVQEVTDERVKFKEKKRGVTDKGWLEKGLRTAEPLVANGDDLPIRKLIALLQRGRGGSCGHLILKVQCNIAQLLLDITDNFSFSCMRQIASVKRHGCFHVKRNYCLFLSLLFSCGMHYISV